MTISQTPEKKKKRRNRKRKSLEVTHGPDSADLCNSVGKKPRLNTDSVADLPTTSASPSVRNHNLLTDNTAETDSKIPPAVATGRCAGKAAVSANSALNSSNEPADDEDAERHRIKVHLHKQRKALPIFPVRKELVRVIRQRDCVILIGETACGKTTQLPQMMYAVKPQEDYIFSALVTVFQIHRNQGPGDILVFCTGQEEIESAVRAARETRLQLDRVKLLLILIHSFFLALLQRGAKCPRPPSVLGTPFKSAAESVSADSKGLEEIVKQRTYQPGTGLEVLKVRKISKAQAWQRAGRAGRECSGVCYRLYTKMEYEAMKEHSTPEIQRCSLSGVVLQMLALGIKDIFAFDFMDKPSDKHLMEALVKLHQLGAIEKKDDLQLTVLGQKMAAFPLEPRFSKIILCSKELGCTDEILTIISILSGDSVLYFNEKHRERAAEVWKKFQSNEGDHVMLLNVYKAYKSVKGNKMN
ncbi:hypothetical protein V5799_022244 [Amblyomma americanum]|uniref:RNA helicase n=1 Tax=Amblyomma americanum TaxID=6943 RepID=A0AAQ4FML7_AMBAM